MSVCVADVSALLKPILTEPDSGAAARYFQANVPAVPAIAWAEAANVLRRLIKSKRMSRVQAKRGLADLFETTGLVPETETQITATLDLAIALDHPAQDCRYLAAAIALKVPLITADEAFARKARHAGHDVRTPTEAFTPGG